MLIVQQVSQYANTKPILQEVSFSAAPGRLTILLGANGAGKSTLLRLLAGESSTQKGDIRLDGKPIADYTPHQLALRRAMLTQHFTVSLPFTCEEIVTMGRYPHFGQQPTQADKAVINDCMEEMDVAGFKDRIYHTLSGGEQQRVQLARVLAQLHGQPQKGSRLLLLDEPTSGMDVFHQQLCLKKAKEKARAGAIVIAILHDLNLAAQFGDQLLLLHKGRLTAQGSPKNLLQPNRIRETYGIDVEIVYHTAYDFPIIVTRPPFYSPDTKTDVYATDNNFSERTMDKHTSGKPPQTDTGRSS